MSIKFEPLKKKKKKEEKGGPHVRTPWMSPIYAKLFNDEMNLSLRGVTFHNGHGQRH